MRVLYLTNIPSPYRVDFFNELGKKCELTVLFERHNAKDRNDKWFRSKERNFQAVYLKGNSIGNDTAINLGVFKFLNKRDYDFIILGGYATPTGMLAILYLKLLGIPFILNADGGIINHGENFVKKTIKNFFISSADYWLSSGKQTTKYLEHYGAKSNRILIYPFSSLHEKEIIQKPLSNDEKGRIRGELGLSSTNKIVISVGQFIHRKGIDVLIETWSMIDNHENKELVIIGGGELEDVLKKEIVKKGLSNVKILPFQDKERLLKYYKASDLMMFLTREDIWGLVINEGLACGLPIITTDKCVAGVELINNGENGYIIPVNNAQIAKEKLIAVVENDKLLNTLSTNALRNIKDYTLENMALFHMKILEKIKQVAE